MYAVWLFEVIILNKLKLEFFSSNLTKNKPNKDSQSVKRP